LIETGQRATSTLHVEVADLNHQRRQAAVTALGMNFSSCNESGFASDDCSSFAITAGHPTGAIESDKKLPEASFMWTDWAAGPEVHHIGMGVATAFPEVQSRDALHDEWPLSNLLCIALVETEDLHRRILRDVSVKTLEVRAFLRERRTALEAVSR
jgi:hypothetical protein